MTQKKVLQDYIARCTYYVFVVDLYNHQYYISVYVNHRRYIIAIFLERIRTWLKEAFGVSYSNSMLLPTSDFCSIFFAAANFLYFLSLICFHVTAHSSLFYSSIPEIIF